MRVRRNRPQPRADVVAPPPHPSGARPPQLPAELVPRHVAVVMDGNGRWANQRGLTRTQGHAAGEASLLDALLSGEWELAEASQGTNRREASGLVAALLQWHLERGLRSLAVAGWAPSFQDCARCGAPGPHRAFAVAAGGTVCPACRPSGSASPAPSTLELLAALLAGDWGVADVSEARHRREASGIVAAYLQWHLERGVRSLRLVERS